MPHRILTCALLAAALPASGCAVFKAMAGKNTVMLDEFDVKSTTVDIRKTQKSICPYEATQMAVVVTAVDPDKPAEVKTFETWQGDPRGRHNGALDFRNFDFRSSQGVFVKGIVRDGGSGSAGQSGMPGQSGQSGSSGGTDSPGGDGSDGGDGGQGEDDQAGMAGDNVKAYAT